MFKNLYKVYPYHKIIYIYIFSKDREFHISVKYKFSSFRLQKALKSYLNLSVSYWGKSAHEWQLSCNSKSYLLAEHKKVHKNIIYNGEIRETS